MVKGHSTEQLAGAVSVGSQNWLQLVAGESSHGPLVNCFGEK